MRIILLNLVYSLLKFLSGYRLTPQATETILKRYSRVLPRGGGEACLCAFDDFVSVSVRLRAYTGTVYCSCILEQLLKIQNPWITPRLNSSSLPQRLYCNIHKKTRIFNFDVRGKVFKMPFFCQTPLGKETPCCMDRRRETARSSTMT